MQKAQNSVRNFESFGIKRGGYEDGSCSKNQC